jgi:xylan 1,4-beta-xylosidase
MPQTLASGDQTVFRYQGNVTPPKDYNQWATLISTLAKHWVDRYGIDEVSTWYFEVWNEPNIEHFWTGTRKEYFELYRQTALALKGVDERLRVGGPATGKNQWIDEFIAFCTKHHVPVDFVSTHHYPTDVAEGTSLGNEEDDTEAHLARSRRSILREWAQDVYRSARGRPVHYTEWNTSSNPRDPMHDEPYAAAFVTKTIMEAKGMVESYSFWTFSDIFAENYFPSVPFHGGFGLLNLHGVAKPTYRAFQLLHRLGTEQFLVDGLHETVDAWVVCGSASATVLLTNHALPQHPIQTMQVAIRLVNMLQPRAVHLERIDEYHANAKNAWRDMGEPKYLKTNEVKQLEVASRTVKEPLQWKVEEKSIHLEIELPPHAVAAITLESTLKWDST